ncbi:alpha-glucosidase [Oricola nitratireducens]|uniref:alpha-glucosidase n=1 Tax=Oricola nitratireducens TaxID=2775868 RepID=UPI0018678245|nr:alpha-glucosidase [Oricola nitratireducens]
MPRPYRDDPDWWKDATVYQIYPRSFRDCDGDGVGDIPGIVSKLDYLADLGIGVIWLSPVYASPMEDNGYDISDYRDIAPEFGTLADIDRLIAEAEKRGIGIVMDLVVNHTSDRHAWFEAARSSRDDPKRDYYVWRDPAPDGGPPNGLRSYFGGPAWKRDEVTGQYYLHLFAAGQPDLNWQNPVLRAEIHAMMNWWLDRGIAGFRMDVIDLIGKDPDREILNNGPRLHDYIREMHRETLAGRNVLTVGETWEATPEMGLLFSGRDRHELSMVFQFRHVTSFWGEAGKWDPKPFDLVTFKRALDDWQRALASDGWNSLFLSNHDLPRAVSKYGDDTRYWRESATLLATVNHLMRGTPYVYQGEEIGMTNAGFTEIGQYRDVETLGLYAERMAAGDDPAGFLRGAAANGRDNARTPVQWTAGPNAGFTTGTPWIGVNANHVAINAEAQIGDDASVLAHYRKLIALRKTHPVIVDGDYRPFLEDDPQLFVFARNLAGTQLVVVANFSGEPAAFETPSELEIAGECLISNHVPRDAVSGTMRLAPWEAFAVLAST